MLWYRISNRRASEAVLRCLPVVAAVLSCVGELHSVHAAIWPRELGTLQRTSAAPVLVEDSAVWNEYGLQEAELAEFQTAGRKVQATAYRLVDPTAALAARQWKSAGKPAGTVAQLDNYLLETATGRFTKSEIDSLRKLLPRLARASLPSLPSYLPSKGRVSGSERYVLGQESLKAFAPIIPADVASFHLGAEAQVAKYSSGSHVSDLVIFSYPTPQIARELTPKFASLPGATVRRSGPLVAVAFAPDSQVADHLLGRIQYQAKLTMNEEVPKPPKDEGNPGEMLQAIVTLAGFLIAGSFVVGLALGALRILMRKFGIELAPAGLTELELSKK